MTAGGEWGQEAQLIYEDFGARMSMGYSTARPEYGAKDYSAEECEQWTGPNGTGTRICDIIYAGLEGHATSHNDAEKPYGFGVEYPGFTTDNGNAQNHSNNAFGPIMQLVIERQLKDDDDWVRRWYNFVRVNAEADPNTYTYRICEFVERKDGKWKNKYCWLGAKYGHPVASTTNSFTELPKEHANCVAFTEESKYDVNDAAKGAKDSPYYQWRFVTLKQMKEVMANQEAQDGDDVDANMSYAVKDPFMDWDRSEEFNGGWTTGDYNGSEEAKDWGLDETPKDMEYKSSESLLTQKQDHYKTYYGKFRYAWDAGYHRASSKTVCTVTCDNVDNLQNDDEGTYYGYRNTMKGDSIFVSFANEVAEPWDTPVLRKIQFHNIEDGAISYALFEGAGTAKQKVTVPAEGYYRVQLRALKQTSNTVQFFAMGDGATISVDVPATKKTFTDKLVWYLTKESEGNYFRKYFNTGGDDKAYQWNTAWTNGADTDLLRNYGRFSKMYYANQGNLLSIGTELNTNSDYYTIEAIVHAKADGTITLGVKKDQGTINSDTNEGVPERLWVHQRNDSWNLRDGRAELLRKDLYYYDTDIVAFDNVQVFYLGKDPFVLDEAKEDTTYMTDEIDEVYGQNDERAGQRKNTSSKTFLKRTFTVGSWNSIILPVTVSATQVKRAFGEGTKLSRLAGYNTYTSTDKVSKCIDFNSVDLNDPNEKLEKGKMYIIKPENDAKTITVNYADGTSETIQGYELGRYNWAKMVDGEGNAVLPATEETLGDDVENSKTDLYVKTQGTYTHLYASENYCPGKGDYVFSGGGVYRLAEKTEIKGFRAWLHATDRTGTKSKELTFSFDDSTTYIDGIHDDTQSEDGNVYTLGGQLVRKNADSTNGLQRGVYIVNGKKVVVK